jgi:uncharacterized protein YbjT (DUF2867 family)
MIIITTPTGAIGHQVLEHVLRSAEPIRVIEREPSQLSTLALGSIFPANFPANAIR